MNAPGDDLKLRGWGLRFAAPDVEAGYRHWRVGHVIPNVRIGAIAGLAGWVGGIALFYFGAPTLSARAAAWILGFMFPPLVAGLAFTYTRRLRPLIMPMSVIGNLVSGFLILALGIGLAHNYPLTMGAAVITVFTGLTIIRLSPLLGILGNAPFVLWGCSLTFAAFRAGELGQLEFVWCLAVVLIAFMMGLVVCTAAERMARETYRNERIIEQQQQALLEERANLSKFLSPEVTQMVRERGIEATLAQQTLDLTVVCCDLRGFTAYTEKNGPAQMAAVLRAYYETVVEVARRYGGTVKDFAGDGALILVGAPLPRADHARAGIDLARDLLTAVSVLTARFGTPTTPLGVGAGIATGACAVGAIGSQHRLEYTAVGSAVNLASRLCAQATHGQLLMCAATARLIERDPAWSEAQILLKGFDEPVLVTLEVMPQAQPLAP